MVDNDFHEVHSKFKKASSEIGRMKDKSFATINGIMSSLGVGLS